MANIRPFRAWRYHPRFSERICELSSPLFDVVDAKQREKLYQNPFNSIHLSVPQGSKPVDAALETLLHWKQEKVLVRDAKPSIYVYYQYFYVAGDPQPKCRKGFIANMEAYHWDEGVLLRHENTIPQAVEERLELLRSTGIQASPTHGLYSDPSFRLEQYMDEAIQNPVYDDEDYQGVRDVLSIIDDEDIIAEFVALMKDKQVVLADGHHRYESAMRLREQRKEENPEHTGEEGYNFHMIYLTNSESDDIRILPTHRLLVGYPQLDIDMFLRELERFFVFKDVDAPEMLPEILRGKPWAFGLLLPDQCYKIRLKPEAMALMDWNFPEVVRQLDLTVLHYFVFERALGIRRNQQRHSPYIKFERSFSKCLSKILTKEAQMGFVTNEIPVETVKAICSTGYTMPQKSTYFYPKVLAGLLFASHND